MENLKMCLKRIFHLGNFPEIFPQPVSGSPAFAILLDDESLDASLGDSLGWTMIASAKALQPASLLITATIPQEKPLPGSRPQNVPT